MKNLLANKKLILTVLAIIIANIILGVCIWGSIIIANKGFDLSTGVTDGNGNAMDSDNIYKFPNNIIFSQVNETTATDGINVTFTTKPDYTVNKDINFSLSFKDSNSEWASGKNATEYVTAVKAGSNMINIKFKKAFGEKILLKVNNVENKNVAATCTIDCMKRPIGAKLTFAHKLYGNDDFVTFSNETRKLPIHPEISAADIDENVNVFTCGYDFAYKNNVELTYSDFTYNKTYTVSQYGAKLEWVNPELMTNSRLKLLNTDNLFNTGSSYGVMLPNSTLFIDTIVKKTDNTSIYYPGSDLIQAFNSFLGPDGLKLKMTFNIEFTNSDGAGNFDTDCFFYLEQGSVIPKAQSIEVDTPTVVL